MPRPPRLDALENTTPTHEEPAPPNQLPDAAEDAMHTTEEPNLLGDGEQHGVEHADSFIAKFEESLNKEERDGKISLDEWKDHFVNTKWL